MAHERRIGASGDVVELLLASGINRVEATMAIPYMWFTPGTSDPYSPVVLVIVQGVQNNLAKLGISTRHDGFVDRATSEAITSVVGDRWKAQPWVTIYEKLLAAKKAGWKGKKTMGSYLGVGDIPSSSFTLTAKGSAVGTTPSTKALFKDLQKQLNRLASLPGAGFGKIGVDGYLGNNTVAAVTAAENFIGMSVVPSYTATGVATAADRARDEFRAQADSRGAAAKVRAPVGSKYAGGGGGAVKIDPITGGLTTAKAGFVDELMTPMGLALAAGMVGALWYVSKEMKPKKRRRPVKRRRPAKRRPARRRRR